MPAQSEATLFNSVKKGELSNLLHDLKDIIKKESDTLLMIRLLKSLTQALSSGFPSEVRNTDVCRVAEFLLQHTKYRSKNYELDVIRCVYYIAKHFLQKGEWDLALKVKKYLFGYDSNAKEYLDVYYALFYEFNNLLKKVIHDKKFDYKAKLNLRYETLEVVSMCGTRFLDLILKEAHQVFLEVKSSQNTIDENYNKEIIKFSLEILKLVKNNQDKTIKNDYTWKLYFSFISSLLNYCLYSKEYSLLNDISKNLHSLKTEDKESTMMLSQFILLMKSIVNCELKSEEINKAASYLTSLFKHVNKEFVFYVCSHLTTIILRIQKYWFLEHSKNPSTEEGSAICRFSLTLSKIVENSVESECVVAQDVKYLFEAALNTLIYASCYVTNVIKHAGNQVDETLFLQNIVKIEKQSIRLVTMMKGRGHLSVTSWKNIVTQNIILCQVLGTKECFKYAITIQFIYMNACIKMGTICEEEEIIEKHMTALQDHVYFCTKQKSYKEALIAVAVMSLFLPSRKEMIMKQWLVIKMQAFKEQAHHLLSYTMLDIFKRSEQEICRLFGDVRNEIDKKMNDMQLCQMLVLELKSYATNSAVLYETAIAAGTHAIEHFPRTYMLGLAIELVMKTAYKHEQTELKPVYEKSCKLLENLKHVSCGSEYFHVCSSLGNIHYYFFFAEIVKLRKKLLEEVECTNIFPSKEEKDVKKGVVDPLEAEMKSNIITMYSDLNIAKEQELLSLLNQAFDSWSLCCVDLSLNDQVDERLRDSLANIENTAYTYALYGYNIHCVKTWKLFYKLSAILEDESSMLKAFSQIMEFSTYEPDGDMWQMAENIEESLLNSSNMSEAEREALLLYYLGKSMYYLKNRKYAECMQNLQKGFYKLKEFKELRTRKISVIEAKAFLILSMYQFETCSTDTSITQNKHPYISASQCFHVAKRMHVPKDNGSSDENSYCNWMMLSAVEWITEVAFQLTLYRDVYAYLKIYLKLAQVLGLALRCGRFVARMAQIDLLNHKVESCEAKLNGIEAILQLNEAPDSLLQTKEELNTYLRPMGMKSNSVKATDANTTHDFMLRDTKFLEVDTPCRSQLASPILKRTDFKMPSVIHNSGNCRCFSCNNLLIQNLILDSVCLKAQLHTLQGENELALTFFCGGIHLGKQLMRAQTNVLTEFSKSIFPDKTGNYFPNYQDDLHFVYHKLLSQQAVFLYFCSNIDDINELTNWPQASHKSLNSDVIEQVLLLSLKNATGSEEKQSLLEGEVLNETVHEISITPEEEKWQSAKTPVVKSKFIHFHAPVRKDKLCIKSVSPSLVKSFKNSQTNKTDGETNGDVHELSDIFASSSSSESQICSPLEQNVAQEVVQKEKKQINKVTRSNTCQNLLDKPKEGLASCSDSDSPIFICRRIKGGSNLTKTYKGKKNAVSEEKEKMHYQDDHKECSEGKSSHLVTSHSSVKKCRKEINKHNVKKQALNTSSDDLSVHLKRNNKKEQQSEKCTSDRLKCNLVQGLECDLSDKAVKKDNDMVSFKKTLLKKKEINSSHAKKCLKSAKEEHDSDEENTFIAKTDTKIEPVEAEKTKQKNRPVKKASADSHSTLVSKNILQPSIQNEIVAIKSMKRLGASKKYVAESSTTCEAHSCDKVSDQSNNHNKKQSDDACTHKYLRPQRKKKKIGKNEFVL